MFTKFEVCNTTRSTITEVPFSRYSESPHWRIEVGRPRGHCPPPPPPYNWLRCSKLEFADQQDVVNSRS